MHSPARTLVAALVCAGAAGALAWDAARRAAAAVPGLNDEHPPLASVAPVILPPGPPLARRVVVVIIDGLRAGSSRGMPALDALRAAGIDAEATSGFPTSSEPNYVALLAGVPPRDSGVRTNHYATRVPLDSLPARVPTGYATQLSEVVAVLFPQIDAMVVAPAPGAIDGAATGLLARGHRLVVLLHNAPDEAAHLHGAASPAYLAARLEADRTLAAVLAGLDLRRDAIVVVADHGHTDGGGHGGLEPCVRQVPLVLAGAGVRRGALVRGATTADVAPTVAALLGLPAPGHSLGRALLEALDLDPSPRRLALATDEARRRALAPAARPPGDELVGRRAPAAVLLAGLLLLGLRLDRRALAIGAATALAPVLALAAAVGGLSPSTIAIPENLPHQIAQLGLVLVPALVLVARAARVRRRRACCRLAGATGVAIAGLLVSGALSTALWALVDDSPAALALGPAGLVLPALLHAAVALAASALLLYLTVELVAFLAQPGKTAAASDSTAIAIS